MGHLKKFSLFSEMKIEFLIKIKTVEDASYDIVVTEKTELAEFQQKVEQKTQIPVVEQKLLSRGKEVAVESAFEAVKMQEIPVIHVSDTRQIAKPITKPPSTESEVLQKYKMCWTLTQNCDACLAAYASGMRAANRQKINRPPADMPLSTPNNPTASDLGRLADKLAQIFERTGNISADFAAILRRNDKSEEEIEEAQNKGILFHDLSRYQAALCQTFSGFIIPTKSPAPRLISFKKNPVARNRR